MASNILSESQQQAALAMMDGRTTDTVIARQFGVEVQVIGRLRRKHGIEPVKGHSKFRPSEQQLAELRECSNYEMERRYGVISQTWRKVRREHGIANYRPPTTVGGVPNKFAERPAKGDGRGRFVFFDHLKSTAIPGRDTSLTGEAASFLRRERFVVYDRQKVRTGTGWQVGHSVLSETQLVEKAKRLGFQQQEWMG